MIGRELNCREFDERIQQLLDDRSPLAADAALRNHAAGCPDCETTLAAYGLLVRQTKALPRPTPSRDFSEQVLAQVGNSPVPLQTGGSSWKTLRLIGPLAATAALVLLAVGVGSWANLNRDRGATGNQVADGEGNRPQNAAPAPGVVGIVVPGPRTPKTRTAPQLAEGAPSPAPQMAKTGRPNPAPFRSGPQGEFVEYRTAIHTLAMQLPGAVSQIDAMQQNSPAIRPIRESFSTALQTLWRTIPGRQENQPAEPPQAKLLGETSAELA